MHTFETIIRKLSSTFGPLQHQLKFAEPQGDKEKSDILFFEIRSSPSYIKIFDPLRKPPRFRGNIIVEFYNINLLPEPFIGEVEQNVFGNQAFVSLLECILDEEDHRVLECNIIEELKKFSQ